MQSRTKKIIFAVVLLIGTLFLGFGYFYQNLNTSKEVKAQMSGQPLKGWAWSSNIGWVKFDGWSDSVELLPSGKLRGYAWSSNIGWIDFSPSQADINASVNLTDPKKPAEIDFSTKLMSGYARALSYGDGWDGWIKMAKGPSDGGGDYGVNLNGNKLESFAWGGDVIGWLNFNPDFGGVTIDNLAYCNFTNSTESASPIRPGESATLSWSCTNVNTCNIKNDSDNSAVCGNCGDSGNIQVSPVKTTSYTLSCTAAGSSPAPESTMVNVSFKPTRCEVNPRTGVLECP